MFPLDAYHPKSVISATSDDEDEAFERLLKLSLKGEKERELVHVLIAMMMKEKTFNAFYAALLQRFCEFNKRFVVSFQKLNKNKSLGNQFSEKNTETWCLALCQLELSFKVQ